jgi:SAM-dependent methyltransferase
MRSVTLPQPWRKVLLTVHVAASVSVLGADLVLLTLGSASLTGADPLTIYPAARLVGAWLVAPLALLALGTGLLLGLLTPWGLFTYWWVTIKLAIVVVLTGAVLFVLVPALGATADAVSGPTPRPLAAGERLPLFVAPAVASTLLAVALVLAIFKPGWRFRSGAGAAEANRSIDFPRLYDLLLLILTRGREQAYRANLLDLGGVASGHRVLDVGCGTGTQAIAMWRRSQPGGAVVGVDIADKMLAAARRKARRAGLDITFHHADAAQLPFENDWFDVVTITTVMHMVPPSRQRLCLREAARVLRPGGRLLLIDYAGDPEDRRHWTAKYGPHRVFDLHSLREPLSEEGFVDIEGGPLDWLGLHFLRGTKRRS